MNVTLKNSLEHVYADSHQLLLVFFACEHRQFNCFRLDWASEIWVHKLNRHIEQWLFFLCYSWLFVDNDAKETATIFHGTILYLCSAYSALLFFLFLIIPLRGWSLANINIQITMGQIFSWFSQMKMQRKKNPNKQTCWPVCGCGSKAAACPIYLKDTPKLNAKWIE